MKEFSCWFAEHFSGEIQAKQNQCVADFYRNLTSLKSFFIILSFFVYLHFIRIWNKTVKLAHALLSNNWSTRN